MSRLSASLENYLKAIFIITAEKGAVRVKDISNYLGVKAGSVTSALKALSKTNHINYKPYSMILLTSKGFKQAQKINQKHKILKEFFIEILGADIKESDDVACNIEHVMTDQILHRLVCFVEFLSGRSKCSSNTIDKFHDYYNQCTNPCDKIRLLNLFQGDNR
jgi:DtxR family Mn-dependent transcriptional regulator